MAFEPSPSGCEVQHRVGRERLRRREGVTRQFLEEHADDEAQAFVAIDERMVSSDGIRVQGGRPDDVRCVCVGLMLLRAHQRRGGQARVAQAGRAAVGGRGSNGVAQRADAELGDAGEVPEVAGDEIEVVLEGTGGDLQGGVGQRRAAVRYAP